MQDSIQVEQYTLELNQVPQPYEEIWLRYIGFRKNCQVPDKWVNKTLKSHWIYSFVNIETEKIIEFEFDTNDEFLRIVTNK